MKKLSLYTTFGLFSVCLAVTALLAPRASVADKPHPREVDFFIPPLSDGTDNPNPFLASGVSVGKKVSVYYSAGTGPSFFADCDDPDDPAQRFIDPAFYPDCYLDEEVTITEAQGINALNRIQQNLQEQGLSLEDVIFLRIYLEAPAGEERADYDGWNRAYRKFFANVDLVTGHPIEDYEPIIFVNATRPARTNLEVASLPVSGWLVELEAIATFSGPSASQK
jgi:enamine deaminase RidA (YjgF/YER057c/UK114 family)